jgi:hypothetical protein
MQTTVIALDDALLSVGRLSSASFYPFAANWFWL